MPEAFPRTRAEYVADKYGDYVQFFLSGTTAATTGNYNVFFTARHPMEVMRVTARFSAASTSGTLQLRKCASGVAKASGSDILSTTISLAGTANTDVVRDSKDLTGNSILREGDSLCVVEGGTLTNLQNLAVTIYYTPLGRGEYR